MLFYLMLDPHWIRSADYRAFVGDKPEYYEKSQPSYRDPLDRADSPESQGFTHDALHHNLLDGADAAPHERAPSPEHDDAVDSLRVVDEPPPAFLAHAAAATALKTRTPPLKQEPPRPPRPDALLTPRELSIQNGEQLIQRILTNANK